MNETRKRCLVTALESLILQFILENPSAFWLVLYNLTVITTITICYICWSSLGLSVPSKKRKCLLLWVSRSVLQFDAFAGGYHSLRRSFRWCRLEVSLASYCSLLFLDEVIHLQGHHNWHTLLHACEESERLHLRNHTSGHLVLLSWRRQPCSFGRFRQTVTWVPELVLKWEKEMSSKWTSMMDTMSWRRTSLLLLFSTSWFQFWIREDE